MKTYKFSYNNGMKSTHDYECDADAMMSAREELDTMTTCEPHVNRVDVWRMIDGVRFDYIVSYKAS